MDENKSARVCVFMCALASASRVLFFFLPPQKKVRGGLAKTTTTGPEMSCRNVSGGSVGIYEGPAKEREGEGV